MYKDRYICYVGWLDRHCWWGNQCSCWTCQIFKRQTRDKTTTTCQYLNTVDTRCLVRSSQERIIVRPLVATICDWRRLIVRYCRNHRNMSCHIHLACASIRTSDKIYGLKTLLISTLILRPLWWLFFITSVRVWFNQQLNPHAMQQGLLCLC